MRNRYVAAVRGAGFVVKVPDHDARISGVFRDDFLYHGIEAPGVLRFVQRRVVADLVGRAVRGIPPSPVIPPVTGLRAELLRPVIFILRHGAVVCEADHDRDPVFRGDGEELLEPQQKAVVLLVPDDELQQHPDRIEAGRRRKLQLAVRRRQMLFPVELLPERDPVAAVCREVVAAAQPRHFMIPFPDSFLRPLRRHIDSSRLVDDCASIILYRSRTAIAILFSVINMLKSFNFHLNLLKTKDIFHFYEQQP